MVRQLLGNIRGPQGAQGNPGEGLENNMIGSENLFSMSREKWRYSGNIVEYDYRNGIIKFSNSIYQFRYEIYLREGNYTVHVDDVINPERAGFENTVTLTLYDSDQNNMRTIGVIGSAESGHPNTRSFDITESEENANDGVFFIQISIANSGRHTGQIKGLQVVRGELCPTWGPSTDDSVAVNSQLMVTSPYRALEGGTRTTLNLRSTLENDDILSPGKDDEVILTEGLWSFEWVYSMRAHTDGEQCITRVMLNDELFLASKIEGDVGSTISTKIRANEGDTLIITQEVPVGSSYQIDRSVTEYSRLVLYKIGGNV